MFPLGDLGTVSMLGGLSDPGEVVGLSVPCWEKGQAPVRSAGGLGAATGGLGQEWQCDPCLCLPVYLR